MASGIKTKIQDCWRRTKQLSNDYAKHSTVHGVSYITEPERSLIEKVWWICVLIVSVCICGKLIFDATNISPIIISFADKPTPIWWIPFPAVTICPKIVSSWSLTKINNSGEEYFESLSEKEKLKTLAKNAFCRPQFELVSLQNYSNCNECLKIMREIKIPPEEIFVDCRFMNGIINCTEALEEMVVDSQICYTFNGRGLYRHNDHYEDVSDRELRRPISAGPQYGLSVLLRVDRKYVDLFCTEFNGFMVEYRTAYESPQFMTNFFLLRMDKSMNLIVHPKMIVTSTELQGYSLQARKCYFDNERRLQYFRKYTQSNCEIECEINLVVRYCDRLPVYIENRNGIDILGPNQSACALSVRIYIAHQNYRLCNCLPTCTAITFESEVQVARLNNARFLNGSNEEVKFSRLNVYFKENQFMTIKRTELYGQTEFLASCGGLLSLFLGMSVLSFLEIIYFCTVRLWITVRSRNKIEVETVLVEPFQRVGLPKSNRMLEVFEKLISDYSSKSTLQGIRYVGMRTLSKSERVWWAFIIGVSVFSCGSLIHKVLMRNDHAPVIISYANEETKISEIPFPAVTICPQFITFQVTDAFDYFRIQNQSLYTLAQDTYDTMIAVAQICDPSLFGDIDPENRTDCENCTAKLKELLSNADRLFMQCNHIYRPSRCSEMFQAVITAGGICFVYNAFQTYRDFTNGTNDDITDNWTIDGGYRNNTGNVDVQPRAGSKIPLNAILALYKSNVDYVCTGGVQGFKVYLHMPNESPQIAKQFFLLPYQHFTEILINPKMTVTSSELREFAVAKRQCYFSDERYLRLFRHYTQNNCEIECLANFTRSRCGCWPFYLPKVDNVKFCGISDIQCQQTIFQLDLELKLNQEDSNAGCHCLATCTSITYDTEVNHVFYSDEESDVLFGDGFSEIFRYAKFNMIFKENQFVALKRSQLFGKTEILANCGGLLGLFLGFSFISVLELFYFCFIRLFIDLKKLL